MEQVKDNMKITVITVCFNASSEIEKTLESILNQTAIDNMEVIVIDGGSTDGTVEKIRRYESRLTRFISEPDKGIYNAMNKGIALSTGDYVNFMNAGDSFFNSEVIADVISEVGRMEHRPDVIYGATVFTYPDGYAGQLSDLSLMPGHMGACHQSIFVDGDMIRKAKFDESFRISADFELMNRLYNEGARFAELKKYVAVYNFDGVSESVSGRLRGIAERRRVRNQSVSPLMCRIDDLRCRAGMIRRRITDKIRRIAGLPSQIASHVPLEEIKQL
ncbi:MAG: glycosyltransferase [Duncaniella sp.]|nr:glycosyltransferase [Duncaniella sp.]